MITTPPPVPEPIAFDALLARSWALFRRNWVVALPPLIGSGLIVIAVIAFIGAVVVAAFPRGALRPEHVQITNFVVAYLALVAAVVVVALWSQAAMYGMADAVWEHGTTTFGDGFTAFRTRAGALIVAAIGIFGLAIVALILALPTLGLALLALPLVTMYVTPAVVSGGLGGFAAIGESFRLVRRFFGPSAIALLVLVGIAYGISFIASFAIVPVELAALPTTPGALPHMPPIGLLVGAGLVFMLGMLASFAYSGYRALAIVGLYRSLVVQPASPPVVTR